MNDFKSSKYWECTELGAMVPVDLKEHDAKVIDEFLERIKAVSWEVPYENSAFGYGVWIAKLASIKAIARELKEKSNGV